MGTKINLIGIQFGRLTVINQSQKTASKFLKWVCKCECGNYVSVFGNALRSGSTSSCGCLGNQKAKETHTIHGHGAANKQSPEYISYYAMRNRCYSIHSNSYIEYGGRGIKVCNRWLGKDGFINFLSDMGKKPSPSHSIDRFPDMNGNYEPSNCRWATSKQQAENIRKNIWLEYKGRKMIMANWTKELGIHHDSIRYHLKNGKPFCEIIEHFQNKKTNAASTS